MRTLLREPSLPYNAALAGARKMLKVVSNPRESLPDQACPVLDTGSGTGSFPKGEPREGESLVVSPFFKGGQRGISYPDG